MVSEFKNIAGSLPSPEPQVKHSFGHVDCPACEWARKQVIAKIIPSMLFSDAAALWLESRSLNPGAGAVQGRFIKANTEKSYRAYVDSLKWAAEQLLARARDLGASSPVHYIFPFRSKNAPFDPTRPMTVSGIKRQWNEVRAASGLKWFRQYDTRHTAITRWAEAGMGISEIMSMAGHMTRRMMLHYTHISQQAKRRALEAVAERKGPESAAMSRAPFYVSQKQM